MRMGCRNAWRATAGTADHSPLQSWCVRPRERGRRKAAHRHATAVPRSSPSGPQDARPRPRRATHHGTSSYHAQGAEVDTLELASARGRGNGARTTRGPEAHPHARSCSRRPRPEARFVRRCQALPLRSLRLKARATETQRRAPALLQAGALRGWGAPKKHPRSTYCLPIPPQAGSRSRSTDGVRPPNSAPKMRRSAPPVVFGQMRNFRSQPFQQTSGYIADQVSKVGLNRCSNPLCWGRTVRGTDSYGPRRGSLRRSVRRGAPDSSIRSEARAAAFDPAAGPRATGQWE